MQELSETEAKERDFIKQLTDLFYKSPTKCGDNVETLYGKDALQFFSEVYKKNSIKLNSKIILNGRNDDFVRATIMCIEDAKKGVVILLEYLKYAEWIATEQKQRILILGNELVQEVSLFTNLLYKNYLKKIYEYGDKEVNMFERIIELFDLFVSMIKIIL